MTTKENAAYLQAFADEHTIPLDLIEEDGAYRSFKKIVMRDVDTGDDIIHGILVDDDLVTSQCILTYDEISDADKAEELCLKLQEKTGFFFEFDREDLSFSVGILGDASYFDDMPAEDKEYFTDHFFFKPCKLGRLVYEAYSCMENDGLSAEDAIAKAIELAEEFGLDYEYKYNIVREQIEKSGARYYVEHIAGPEIFYDILEYTVEKLIEEGSDGAKDLFGFAFDDYDIPIADGFDSLRVNVIENSDKVKCVDIEMPPLQKEYDCSDIILLVSDKKLFYYTIENGAALSGKIRPSVYLCGWDEDGTHQNFGVFNCRDRAFKELKKRLKSLK